MAKTKIGGQAVMEGVMMRGEKSMALCVRDENGTIRTETKRLASKKPWYRKVPIIRGVVNLVVSLVSGMSITMKSAEIAIESEIDTKDNGYGGLFLISALLGVALAVGLFIWLPTTLVGLILDWSSLTELHWLRSLLEGIMKLLILIGYFAGISCMKDIKRVFMYHGAEHKTIACFESGMPLTVENVKKCSRYHDRCGTSFVVFVVLLSIVVSFVIDAISYASGFDAISLWYVRVPIKIGSLPIVAGLSYEMLMLLAKTDFILLRPLKWFGKQFQKLTTKEPDDSMMEVAICAFDKVLLMDADESIAEENFPAPVELKEFKKHVIPLMDYSNMEKCDLDWILCAVLRVKRSELRDDLKIPFGWQVKVEKYVKRCANGEPLQYVLNDACFYKRTYYVDQSVLIPRQETELVCEEAMKYINADSKVLDLCCGSGVIGVTIQAEKGANVVCADISKDALKITKYNAKNAKAKVKTVCSDMFEKISGTFDVIVCNPPYVTKSEMADLPLKVQLYEPHSALYGGEDGLDYYRTLSYYAKRHLKPSGVLVMEIGYLQGDSVTKIMEVAFDHVTVLKDYGGCDRIVVCTSD